MASSIRVPLMGILTLLAIGCGGVAKLNETRSFTVPDGENMAKIYIMPAQKGEQNAKIEISSDQPVDVYVLLSKDLPDAENKLPADWEKASLGRAKGAKSEALTTRIPANQEWKIVVTTGLKMSKASGSLKITN